jgi:cytochrome P450
MLDVIGEVTFSRRFGLMEIGVESESLKIIKRAARSASWVGQIPWLYRIHQILSPIIGQQLALNARNGYIRDFTMQQAQSRLARGSDHRDMLSKLIEVNAQKPTEVDHMVVISMASSNVFAGSDTTAIALRSIFYHLLKNPRRMQRLLKEIDDVTGEMDLDKPVTFEQANRMPYLQAVMNEALRLHPIIGQSLPRVVPEGGLQIEEHLIPKGVGRWYQFQDKSLTAIDNYRH